MRMRKSLLASVVVASLVLAACGDDDDEDGAAAPAASDAATTPPALDTTAAPSTTGGGEAGGGAADCAAGKTIEDGVLTIATGEPAFPPYVLDNDPASGQGFEAAVGMAVARELGFTGDAVKWIGTSFDAAVAPGPKDFDFNLQQFTITPERAEAVSFSEGYYTAPQAIFGLADSPAASATTLAELKGLKIGVAAGTTSIDYVEQVI